MTTATPAPKGLELSTIKRSMQPDVISSFWTMLQELRGKANDDDDPVLKVQVEGWYRQWNRMTGDNKEPNWSPRQEALNVRELLSQHQDTYPGPREPEAIALQIQKLVAEQLGIEVDDVVRASTLRELGTDSLDEVELVMAVEDEFFIEISDEDAEKMTNMETAVSIVLRELSRQP